MTYDDPPVAGTWCGEPLWRCPYCAYDSPDENRVREHIQWAHPNDPELVISVPDKAAKGVKQRATNDTNQNG